MARGKNFVSLNVALEYENPSLALFYLKLAKFCHAPGLLNFASWLIDLRSFGGMVCRENFVSLNVAFEI